MPLFSTAFDKNQYSQLLKAFYGLHKPLEDACDKLLTQDQKNTLEWSQRQRTPKLILDLEWLGHKSEDIQSLPECAQLPPLTRGAHALGVLYVLEGSTLGGQQILTHLKQQLDVTADQGASYYAGHGLQTGPFWKRFSEYIKTFPWTEEDSLSTIQAAQGTFQSLEHWFLERGVFR